MARGVKVWSAEVSESILTCSDKVFSIISLRMAFARRPLIEIRRLKWLDGSLQVMVRIFSGGFLFHVNWMPCSLPFDRGINCLEIGKPYLICDSRSHSYLLQDLNGNVSCSSLLFVKTPSLSKQHLGSGRVRFW